MKTTETKQEVKHTPTPWQSWQPGYEGPVFAMGPHGKCPMIKTLGGDEELNRSNAEFVIRAVNSHEVLVKAVSNVLEASEDGGDMNDIDWKELRAALALAEKP